MMKKEYLAIRNLTAGEEGTQLRDFHLRMSRGDFVELLGTEGAGKTAAADFFAGREKILSGFVRLGDARYGTGDTLSGADILAVSRKPSVVARLSVAENLLLLTKNRRVHGIIRHRDLEARASFLLSEFGLSIRAGAPAWTLSEGEKRAVELIRAAENEAPFIFLDNIFGALGRADMRVIEDCLTRLKERGHTILVLGGGFPLFPGLDDRIIVLRGGRNVRTFYRGGFDREAYVKWALGIQDPARVRAEALIRMEHEAGWNAAPHRGTAGTPAAETREAAAETRKGVPVGADRFGEEVPVFRLEMASGRRVRSFSLSVRAGEILGLYDVDNEANRELLQLILGNERLVSGSMLLGGAPYAPASQDEAIRRGIAYIPRNIADCAVVERMSYEDNLTLASMRRMSRTGFFRNARVIRYLAREYSRELELPARGFAHGPDAGSAGAGEPLRIREKTDMSALTGADLNAYDRIRCAMQRILLARPSLVLIEDVVSDMNVRMLSIQAEYLSRYTEAGSAVLISSQNFNVLRQIAHRVIVMNG